MIEQLLDLIDEYIKLKTLGNNETLECRKAFSTILMEFIDNRVQADKKDINSQAIELLSNAPDPGDENFSEKYQLWFDTVRNFL